MFHLLGCCSFVSGCCINLASASKQSAQGCVNPKTCLGALHVIGRVVSFTADAVLVSFLCT
eukprot:238784-Amphidinium_carterae.1